MSAFRKQVELAQKDEREYVVDQIPLLQKNVNKAIKALTDKIATGEFEEKDVVALNSALNTAKEFINISSRLLGYDQGVDETEFNLKIKGRKHAWNHYLPSSGNGGLKELEKAQEVPLDDG